MNNLEAENNDIDEKNRKVIRKHLMDIAEGSLCMGRPCGIEVEVEFFMQWADVIREVAEAMYKKEEPTL